MNIGIFAKTFVRPTLEEVFQAAANHGLRRVQFNFSCAGLPNLPERIDPGLLEKIRAQAAANQLTIVALSGTFNMIHPDIKARRDGLERLSVLAATSRELRIPYISLCTGTRDPEDMWRRHADNQTPKAWRDLTVSMSEALSIADKFNVTLGIEPEVSNVVDSAGKARRLLDEMQSPHLKIIMDGANLFGAGQLPRMREVLEDAFDLLGPDIVIAHAKDLDHDGEAGHLAAGKGLLDYDLYLRLLKQANFEGPLLLHGLAEEEVDAAVSFLRARLALNS